MLQQRLRLRHPAKSLVLGGGRGLQALNDVWTFSSFDRMRLERVTISGCKRPSPCGFLMANLIGRYGRR